MSGVIPGQVAITSSSKAVLKPSGGGLLYFKTVSLLH